MASEQPRSGEDVRDDVMSAPGPPDVRRDRREHGGAPERLDDAALAERTEQERVDAGLADYAPGDVPPATDDPVPGDLTATARYQDEQAAIDRGPSSGGGDRPDFPPSHYPDR